MPLSKASKAIRFRSLHSMALAMEEDKEYQYRHLILAHLMEHGPCTRLQIAEAQSIPVNAMSRSIIRLKCDGAVTQDVAKGTCPITGCVSSFIRINPAYKGMY